MPHGGHYEAAKAGRAFLLGLTAEHGLAGRRRCCGRWRMNSTGWRGSVANRGAGRTQIYGIGVALKPCRLPRLSV